VGEVFEGGGFMGGYKLTKEKIKQFAKEKDCEWIEQDEIGSKIVLKFLHNKCGKIFEMKWNTFQQGHSCQHCHSQARLEYEFVYNIYFENGFELLEKEYKNSATKMETKCLKCGHVFFSKYGKVQSGYGCPECAKTQRGNTKRINLAKSGFNIVALHPELTIEWSLKNTEPPELYTPGSGKKVWWICPNGHEDYYSSIPHRLEGKGCPVCGKINQVETLRKNIIKDRESFGELFPILSKEWHPVLNGNNTPFDFLPGSMKVVYWQCLNNQNHAPYRAKIDTRTRYGCGCPACDASGGEQLIQNILEHYKIKYQREYRFDDCRDKNTLPFDFAVWKDNNFCLIEFHGELHYESFEFFGGDKELEDRKKKDLIKENYAKCNEIKLIIIPYWERKNAEKILIKELNIINDQDAAVQNSEIFIEAPEKI
jgi:hypothetical protein